MLRLLFLLFALMAVVAKAQLDVSANEEGEDDIDLTDEFLASIGYVDDQ